MENIAQQLSNVSLYDVKKYVRKAQNAVLNVTDMEAKVREATNNEPWSTSTTVMQQIADATNSYQQFHEIMPFVYRRFSEKSASEWRQIYKSLQLLDFLVRNGSERVVDYARSHLSVVEMLRHFSYIDSKGVDQGASIRKRAEELVGLLNSNERLRIERKKAKRLNAKTGISSRSSSGVYANDQFNEDAGGFGGSGSRYGGFSSDTYRARFGAASNNGGRSSFASDRAGETADAADDEFEEYEAPGTSSKPAKSKPAKTTADDDDDDFADFQTAPSSAPSKPASSSILDLFSIQPDTSSNATTINSTNFQSPSHQPAHGQTIQSPSSPTSKPATKPQNDLFDSLWETGKSYTPSKSVPTKATNGTSSANAVKPETKTTAASASTGAATNNNSEVVDLLSF